jgi:hypothetical protein
VPPTDASTTLNAEQAVAYLEEISIEMRGCAILSEAGGTLAASGDLEEWGGAARRLVAAGDAAGREPAAHVHVATGEGEVFCVREGGLVGVAVTERFVLASLMVFDLRSVLRDLAVSEA